MTATAPRKKLIEVSLPLEAINVASAKEKSIRHGHPSTLHLWWARRPLAACRAVLFASLVDDPGSDPTLPEAQVQAERDRLHGIIEELVIWENSTNETVLAKARKEILRCTDNNPPPVLDPFCGGGSIPLEAQRLGLEAHGSDLNPVAVLITKALIEIPPRFAGNSPVNPDARARLMRGDWKGAAGLADDVRYYGRWMRDEAERRIGHLYPKARLPKELGGGEATVIAWLWARTVTCPNPACRATMPLVRSFALSTKKSKQTWVEPVVDPTTRTVSFTVCSGAGKAPEGTVNRNGARCICCGSAVPLDHVRAEGKVGRMGAQLMAVVAESVRGRTYLAPTPEQESTAADALPERVPDTLLPEQALGFRIQAYGMTRHRDLFTPRQLVALTTFSDLIGEARTRVHADTLAASLPIDLTPLADGGHGATAYADAIATYLAFAVDKASDRNTSLCTWESGMDRMRNTFGRQAISMIWDFAETNPFAGAGGDVGGTAHSLAEVLDSLIPGRMGVVSQRDATAHYAQQGMFVSTDPPYYDNVGYADLSDFFYVWLRRSLWAVYPDLFGTLLVPKAEELIATPYRFGGSKKAAETFFKERLQRAFDAMHDVQRPDVPMSVYYAFKQAEDDGGDDNELGSVTIASTGWETMLEALVSAGFAITGTWPMRTELSSRPRGRGSNALASSIVIVCRPRPDDAKATTRAEFVRALKRELPAALRDLQGANIAPVDLAQASIGPGMAIYSRARAVLEPSGDRLPVRTALVLINQALDEVLSEQEGEYDSATRWAIAWFEQHGLNDGLFGDAEGYFKAKATSLGAVQTAGIVSARAGKVRLFGPADLPDVYDPAADKRPTVWEATHHLIRLLEGEGGMLGAGRLVDKLGANAEIARDLAYRLYVLCDRKGWADLARSYNGLVVSWPHLRRDSGRAAEPAQAGLL